MYIELPYRPPLDVLPAESSYRKWIEGGLKRNAYNHELTRYTIALPCACISNGSLDSAQWRYERVGEGYLVVHKDFLAIQDEFPQFERDLNTVGWNGEKAYETLTKYLSLISSGKEQVRKIFWDSVDYISSEYREEITYKGRKFLNDLIPPSLVALPDPESNRGLWTDFYGFPSDYQLEVKFAKISEEGRIFASRKFRNEELEPEYRGHDYFSYAARFIREGRVPSLEQKLLNGTGKHELSHDVTDYLVAYKFMELPDGNPISEGYAGMMGEDRREYQRIPFQTSLSSLFQNPILGFKDHSSDQSQRKISYGAFARVFRGIEQILTERYKDQKVGLVHLTAVMLETACSLQNEVGKNPLDEEGMNSRVSHFFYRLIEQLKISQNDLSQKYDDLTSISTDPYL